MFLIISDAFSCKDRVGSKETMWPLLWVIQTVAEGEGNQSLTYTLCTQELYHFYPMIASQTTDTFPSLCFKNIFPIHIGPTSIWYLSLQVLPLLYLDLPSHLFSWGPYSHLSHHAQACHNPHHPRTKHCHHQLYTMSAHHRSRMPRPPLGSLPVFPRAWA